MQIHYRITGPIRAILKRWDWLGFDTEKEAAEAILTHDDWAQRWDLSGADLDDLSTMDRWKRATVSDDDNLHPLFSNIISSFLK